jgi:hypothetical protein
MSREWTPKEIAFCSSVQWVLDIFREKGVEQQSVKKIWVDGGVDIEVDQFVELSRDNVYCSG